MRNILFLAFFIILITSCKSSKETAQDDVYDIPDRSVAEEEYDVSSSDYYRGYNDITHNDSRWYNYSRFGFGVGLGWSPMYYGPYWGNAWYWGNPYGYYNPWNSGMYYNPWGYYGYCGYGYGYGFGYGYYHPYGFCGYNTDFGYRSPLISHRPSMSGRSGIGLRSRPQRPSSNINLIRPERSINTITEPVHRPDRVRSNPPVDHRVRNNSTIRTSPRINPPRDNGGRNTPPSPRQPSPSPTPRPRR